MGRQVALALSVVLIAVNVCHADEILETSLPRADSTINLPYAFWNESFGFTLGYVYALNGFPQPQAGLIATIMAGSTGSVMGFVMGQNIRPFDAFDRLFVDPIFSEGYFQDVNAFIDGNPRYPNQRAGSNNSSEDNYVSGNGTDTFARVKFKYLLPIGTGRERIVPDFRFENGLPISGLNGGETFNPLVSGSTFVELLPFYRSQNVNSQRMDIRSGDQRRRVESVLRQP